MTFNVAAANMDFVRDGDRAYLEHLCDTADLLLVQEAKSRDLDAIAPTGFRALQDTSSAARAGSAILYRPDRLKLKDDSFGLRLGTEPDGARMLARWIATAIFTDLDSGRGFRAASFHLPPLRFRRLQPPMVKRVKSLVDKTSLPVVLGCDANQPLGALSQRLGLQGYGKGIVGILTDCHVQGTRRVDTWGERNRATDHPSIHISIIVPKEQP